VANTHIFWDPEYADVKLWQTWILLQELEKLVLHRNLPLLLCGDFNSTTDSSVYELLANERVASKHAVFKNDPCGLLPAPNDIISRLPLVSAYAQIGEPKYTNYTGTDRTGPAGTRGVLC
jgi:CCR4-NOT transcription complex subunit 6